MKKLISSILVVILALALCVPAAAFSDVSEDAWYAEAVDFCQEHGLLEGYPDGTFRPEADVTRAQLVTTLWRMSGKPEVERLGSFDDVKDDAWYADAVYWAVNEHITDGMGHGNFCPGVALTREMLATFLYRYAGCPAAEGADFADQAEIAAWAQDAARWAHGAGIMQGVGEDRFAPKQTAQRKALAQTLMNYMMAVSSPAVSELAVQGAPVGVALAEDGALYITDGWGKAVWALRDGACERAAGAETPEDAAGVPMGGYLDGAADKSLFRSPWGIAPFLGGWAVSDPENNTVRILRSGMVETANGLDYHYPTGLAADGEGRLYIANTHAGEILLVTPEGEVTKAVEGLDNPMGLCFRDGVLYIAETGARHILKLEDGQLTLLAGSGSEGSDDGAAEEASFVAPEGVAVADDGSVYVADTVGAAVRRIKDGTVTTVLRIEDPRSPERFPAAPVGLLADGTQLYVCDRYAEKLVVLTID